MTTTKHTTPDTRGPERCSPYKRYEIRTVDAGDLRFTYRISVPDSPTGRRLAVQSAVKAHRAHAKKLRKGQGGVGGRIEVEGMKELAPAKPNTGKVHSGRGGLWAIPV